MAYDYQIAKMIISKLLKVKLKSNTRKNNISTYLKVYNSKQGLSFPDDYKYSTRNIFRYDN